jgi:hypothetical protein
METLCTAWVIVKSTKVLWCDKLDYCDTYSGAPTDPNEEIPSHRVCLLRGETQHIGPVAATNGEASYFVLVHVQNRTCTCTATRRKGFLNFRTSNVSHRPQSDPSCILHPSIHRIGVHVLVLRADFICIRVWR